MTPSAAPEAEPGVTLDADDPPAEGEHLGAATGDLMPRIGRARPHASRSVGSPDPGATSVAVVLRAVLDIFDPDA